MSDASHACDTGVQCFREWSLEDIGRPTDGHHDEREYESSIVRGEKYLPPLLFHETEILLEHENKKEKYHPESKSMSMDCAERSIIDSLHPSCELSEGESCWESIDEISDREVDNGIHRKYCREFWEIYKKEIPRKIVRYFFLFDMLILLLLL